VKEDGDDLVDTKPRHHKALNGCRSELNEEDAEEKEVTGMTKH